jgi:hypothetical protein
LTRNYNKIQKKLLIVFSNQPEKLEDAKTINTLIARGIRLALDGLQKQAEEVLDVAKKRLDDFNVDYGIFLYLKGSFLTLSRFVLVLLLLKILPILLPNLFNNIFDLLRIPEEFLIVILFGSLGGFLSVAYGIRNRDIRIDLSSNLKRLAASRIYIAVISSLIIYSALKGDIVDGISFLVKDNTCGISIFKTAFISAVAGFVESFVPDLLTRSSEQNKNSDNNSTGL